MDREEKDPKYWSGQHTVADQDHVSVGTTLASPEQGHGFGDSAPKRKSRKRALWITVVVVLLLAIALGVGLGVGLNSDRYVLKVTSWQNIRRILIFCDSHPSSADEHRKTNGSSVTVGPGSGKGRSPGSGFGMLANPSSNLTTGIESGPSDPGALLAFFQHHTGQVRWMHRSTDGEWLDGSPQSVIATDAKSGTPISAMSTSTVFNQWHVFCMYHPTRTSTWGGKIADPMLRHRRGKQTSPALHGRQHLDLDRWPAERARCERARLASRRLTSMLLPRIHRKLRLFQLIRNNPRQRHAPLGCDK